MDYSNTLRQKFSLLILGFLFLLNGVSSLSAQDADIGNWLMYFGQNRISDDWSIHSEVQYRNHTVAPVNVEQLLLRTGLNYHLGNGMLVTAGYGYIASHDFESEPRAPESTEHRIWQQLILINKWKRLKFEHRYRIEQRWVNNDYRNRLRYRIMLFLPINKPTIEKGTLFLGVYDEVFINTANVFFDRNRLYGALGYQLHETTQVQLGWLYQQLNESGKNYLQLGVVFNPDFRKE